MAEGVLISFEGIDGCGKTTQLQLLAERLRAAGVDPVMVREPGGTHLGERVRDILLSPETGDIAPAAEALLYAASRAELVAQVIEPALARGEVVLVDRYVDSSLAYQGEGRRLGIDRVLEANLLATGGRLPHITILCDVDEATARKRRTSDASAPDRLEQEAAAFFQRTRAAYEELAGRFPERIVRIDASRDIEVIEQDVLRAVAPVLAAHGIAMESEAAR